TGGAVSAPSAGPSEWPSSRCRSRSGVPRSARGPAAPCAAVEGTNAAVGSWGCTQLQADDLRELPSLHLAASGQGQGVEEAHQVGHFVVGNGLTTEVLELVARHDGSLRGHDAGADQLPERLVGDADDAGVAYGRVRPEEGRQLAWIDLVAAADDDLRPAAQNPDVAVLVHEGQGARRYRVASDRGAVPVGPVSGSP